MTKTVGPSKLPLLQDFDSECTLFCHSSRPLGDCLNITVAISRRGDSSDLLGRHIDLHTGEVESLGRATGTGGTLETDAYSLFAHLPLEKVHVDQDSIIFEDNSHYHTLTSNPENSRLGVISTRRLLGAGVHDLFVPLGQRCGVLGMSAGVLTFGLGMAASQTLSVRCPLELSTLLQSEVRLEHVIANTTSQSAAVYIFHSSLTTGLQIWRIRIHVGQGSIQVQQLAEVEGRRDSLHRHSTGNLVNKRLLQVGAVDELRLSFTRGEEIIQTRISIEDHKFRMHKEESILVVPAEPTQVFSNGDTKVATRKPVFLSKRHFGLISVYS